ncbi:hypothetical protein OG605_39350 (plasmid) [Streptomyces xanthophaeus]|uniref:hypothetical protein n=1 Tax=Streptomyces xanthophaeus TaxID=67385 RepID=UPI002F90D0C8|nr:hypothetical protein OG605_39350 [Streptomyces xanthophaeus]
MPSSGFDPHVAEEQLLAAARAGIHSISHSTGTCTAQGIAELLVEQLRAGLLHQTLPLPGISDSGELDVDAVVQANYELETTIHGRTAQVRFMPGLAQSGVAHGEHMDVRAAVTLTYRVSLQFECAVVSTDRGQSWSAALTSAERPWLTSAKDLCPEVGEQVTALMHTPAHGPGLAPVIDAARIVAATRALTQLRVAHGDLAFAGSRAVAARAVFERYGCGPGDAARVQARLRELAAAQHKGLVGW